MYDFREQLLLAKCSTGSVCNYPSDNIIIEYMDLLPPSAPYLVFERRLMIRSRRNKKRDAGQVTVG